MVGWSGFATWPVTQSGFVRVSSNSRAIPEARAPREAREILGRITTLPGHVFWSDDINLARNEHITSERLGSHAQVTDAHLLALTIRHGGRLATFDRGIVDLTTEDKSKSVIVLGSEYPDPVENRPSHTPIHAAGSCSGNGNGDGEFRDAFLVSMRVPKPLSLPQLALGRTKENRSLSRRFRQIQFRHRTMAASMRALVSNLAMEGETSTTSSITACSS